MESLLTRLWLTLLLFAPNPSHGSSDYGDLTAPLTGAAEQNVASLCPQGLEANATNRHCRPQGKRAGESRFPYVCSVRKAGTRKHLCIATLVDRKWLLTTAQCVDPNGDESAGCYPLVYCSSPVVNDVDEEQVFHVVDAYLHADWFGDASYGSNVAMLKLDRNANYPIPRLFREWVSEGTSMAVPLSRWISEGRSSRKCGCCSCEVETRNNDACQKYPQIVSKRSWMCIDGGETDNWTGEEGSPVVVADQPKGKLVKGNPNEDLLVGIKSFSTSDSEGKKCAVYTSVSFFRTWIMKTMGGKTKPSRCVLVPKAEPEKEFQQKPVEASQVEVAKEETKTPEVSKPVTESPVPEARSEPVTESPVPEARSEPVTESPVPEARSEPVTESPVPEAKSETEDQQLIDEFRSLTEEQQIEKMVEAIKADDDKTASALLQAGLDPNAEKSDDELRLSEGSRLLQWAACFGTSKCAEVLLKSGSDIEAVDKDGLTALHEAVIGKHIDTVKMLLDYGANVDAADDDENTALSYAAYAGSVDILEVLLEAGATVDALDNTKSTPLFYAASYGHLDAAKVLVSAGASKTLKDDFGFMPNHYVCEDCEDCSSEMCQALDDLLTPDVA